MAPVAIVAVPRTTAEATAIIILRIRIKSLLGHSVCPVRGNALARGLVAAPKGTKKKPRMSGAFRRGNGGAGGLGASPVQNPNARECLRFRLALGFRQTKGFRGERRCSATR